VASDVESLGTASIKTLSLCEGLATSAGRNNMARRGSFAKLLVAPLVALVAVTGCRLKSQSAPDPTGPSEFGLSLTMSVVPDTLPRDRSQSVLTLTARNENGQPKANVTARIESFCASGRASDVGALGSSMLTTGSGGTATTTFTAPTEEEYLSSDCGDLIFFDATPIDGNYINDNTRTILLKLIPDPLAPVAAFSFTPKTPAINETITFDASASHAITGRKIVSYGWQFGTDRTGSGKIVTKQYGTAAVYIVTLTVTDDYGRKGQLAKPVTVR
jgi:hypothetical protein